MEFIHGIIFLTVLVIAIAYGKKHNSLLKKTYCSPFKIVLLNEINDVMNGHVLSIFKDFFQIVFKSNTIFSIFVLNCLTYHFNLRLLITAIKNMIDVNIDLARSKCLELFDFLNKC